MVARCFYLQLSTFSLKCIVTVFLTLPHLFLMYPFYTPWKHRKTLWFSDVFRGYRNGALGINELIIFWKTLITRSLLVEKWKFLPGVLTYEKVLSGFSLEKCRLFFSFRNESSESFADKYDENRKRWYSFTWWYLFRRCFFISLSKI